MSTATRTASVIIPTFNGANRIGHCLSELVKQTAGRNAEVIVVSDGSTDATGEAAGQYAGVRLIRQRRNAGPAAARNRGALEAGGEIILFTDDDCVPAPDWLDAMLRPFQDPAIVGVKGAYRTRQKGLIPGFVQAEYEDKYRLMASFDSIDFIDTYSAAFRRDAFLQANGYDTSFPVACAEDVELSYRMSAKGWKMKFVPAAVVYHTHPNTLRSYLSKKYKFAFWRMLAVRKNPAKAVRDSHTPQLMKVQLLFAPALAAALIFDCRARPIVPASAALLAVFVATTLPFAWRAFRKNPLVGIVSPIFLAARSCAQLLGVVAGAIHAGRHGAVVPTKSHA